MILKDLSILESHQPSTYLDCLLDFEPRLHPLEFECKGNTEPNKVRHHIPFELIGQWAQSPDDPFPDYDGVMAYARADPEVWTALNGFVKGREWERVLSVYPWASNSEIMVEMNIKTHFDITNLVLEKCVPAGNTIIIQGGKSASATEESGSEPDRASFEFPKNEDGSTYTQCLTKLDREGSSTIQNVIPGEIKVYNKFNRQLLYDVWPERSKSGRKNRKAGQPNYGARTEAEKVFTQIYQYMNERNAAVGYVMTDQELICIRRTDQERYGSEYGVIDISPSIPLSTKRGSMNAKLALWYLHHKYGIREAHLNRFPRTEMPANWGDIIDDFHATRLDYVQIPAIPQLDMSTLSDHGSGPRSVAPTRASTNLNQNRFDPLSDARGKKKRKPPHSKAKE